MSMTCHNATDHNPFRKSLVRHELVRWLQSQRMSHGVTLNVNRHVTLPKLTKMFAAFCRDVDRHRLSKAVHKVPSDQRLLAFAFPEHLATNPHLHVVAKLEPAWWPERFVGNFVEKTAPMWSKITGGAGSIQGEPLHDEEGWGRYVTKEFYRHDHEYLISRDFHPRRDLL